MIGNLTETTVYLYMDLRREEIAVEDGLSIERRHNVTVSLVDGHQEVRQQTFIEAEFTTFLQRKSSQ